ncbi:MAG: mechanosensitive ion channel family protein [Lachnospiraceae bacterium]|nr:mechanosensitive ion channel family protein [Lachnospiraceae bacterium]
MNTEISKLSKLLDEMGSKLAAGAMDLLGRIVAAALIFLIGKKVIHWIIRLCEKAFEKSKMDVGVQKFLLSLLRFALYFVVAISAIGALGVETTSIITVIGSLGLTAGLSLQGSLSNFAGGVLILLSKPFRVGDYIQANGYEGTVKTIDLLYTKLDTVDGKAITMPNGSLSNAVVTNYSAHVERRVDILVDVSYDTDLSKAKDVIMKVFQKEAAIYQENTKFPIQVFVDRLGDSGITMVGRGWAKQADYWTCMWRLREDVKKALDDAGISIPFPQVDVHMKKEG